MTVTYICGTCGTERQCKFRAGKVNLSKDCHSCAAKKINPARWSTKHGDHKTRLYVLWCGIKQRCNYPKSKAYQWYGGKGIKMCPEWESNFATFRDWALSSGYAADLQIDRINNALGYSPENCRWVTPQFNAVHKTNINRWTRPKEAVA